MPSLTGRLAKLLVLFLSERSKGAFAWFLACSLARMDVYLIFTSIPEGVIRRLIEMWNILCTGCGRAATQEQHIYIQGMTEKTCFFGLSEHRSIGYKINAWGIALGI